MPLWMVLAMALTMALAIPPHGEERGRGRFDDEVGASGFRWCDCQR